MYGTTPYAWTAFAAPGLLAPGALPPDLIAAMLVRLRDYNGGSVATAFGESLPRARKFFSTPAVGRPALPYLAFGEPGGLREWFGLANWIDRGTVDMHVYASGKTSVRALALLAAQALDDAPLVFQDGTLKYLRVRSGNLAPTRAVAVGAGLAYALTYSVDYWVQGQG